MGQNSARLDCEKMGEMRRVKVNIPRSINLSQDVLEMTDIHVFGDARLIGTCAVAYVVIRQQSGTKQGLIASKSRLSRS